MAQIKIIEYSEKSIVVIGDTKEIKEQFKVDGKFIGKYNRYLSIKEENSEEVKKTAGWVFSLKQREFVEEIVDSYIKSHKTEITDVFISTTADIETDQKQISLF